MSLDYVVRLDCEPKRTLGAGDARAGERLMLACIVARNRARLLEEIAARDGKAPQDVPVTLRGPAGESRLDYDALKRASDELAPLESACAGCPANVLEQPFGCQACLNYPIPQAAERWLMDQLEKPETLGANLCIGALKELGYDGEPIRALRRDGFFESSRPVEATLAKRFLGSVKVTSDQILHGMFWVGPEMSPSHLLTVLLWFGAVALDDTVPRTREDTARVTTLFRLATPEERRARTDLNLDEPDDGAAGPMSTVLRAFYAAWVLGVPIGVDA